MNYRLDSNIQPPPPGGGVTLGLLWVCFENLCPLGVNIWFPRGLLMGQLLIGVYSLCYLLVFVWLTWSQLWVSPSKPGVTLEQTSKVNLELSFGLSFVRSDQ